MLVEKTVKAKVIEPTNRKAELLEREYCSFQDALEGKDASFYSATKQQAERFLWKVNLAEVVTSYFSPIDGLMFHATIMFALFGHSAFAYSKNTFLISSLPLVSLRS